EKGYLYEILNQLTHLKRQYPDQFRFKVLGTDENFLVCDRSFAVLGTQSLPMASAVFPQAAVGLRTTNPEVIQELVDRFDDPILEADDVIAYFRRAITRYDLGDRPGAIADYTEVLRFNPTDDVALNNRGLAHYDLGDRPAAVADLDRAVQQNSASFVAYCNRGVIRAELGDRMGAIEDYTAALQTNPDYATAYFHRGLARTRTRNKIGAVQDYTEVIRLNPEDGLAFLYRGLACIKLGQRPAAIEDLQKAAQLFSEQGDTANYQQALKTLEKLENTVAIAGSSQPLVPHGV
ncbi:MAG TPA: tetratricopeptide repeat protein, partial [Thermosynechococcaceae cyanobacterium]